MKAMLLRGPNTPFEMVTVPDPVAGPGEAVARVITCGAGLTIQHAKAGRRKIDFPRIIGHEITAEIVQVGAGVSTLKVGDGVTSFFYLNCGHCRYCLTTLEPLCTNQGGNVGLECDGGYAEYIKLPAHIFIKYPDELDYKAHPAEMGVITDALATPYKVLRRAQVKGGETVALIAAGFADFSLIAFHFQKTGSVAQSLVPIFYSVAMVTSGLAALVFGRLLDRFGRPVVVLAFFLGAFFAPCVFLGGFAPALIGMILWGIGMGAQDSLLKATLSGVVPAGKRSTAFGVFDTTFGVAWFAGSAGMGWLYDKSIPALIIFSVLLQLSALPFFFFAKPGRARIASN